MTRCAKCRSPKPERRPTTGKRVCEPCLARQRVVQAARYRRLGNWLSVGQYNPKKRHRLLCPSRACIVCGWKDGVHIHHLDHNHENNIRSNLVPLCPNHHFVVHYRNFDLTPFYVPPDESQEDETAPRRRGKCQPQTAPHGGCLPPSPGAMCSGAPSKGTKDVWNPDDASPMHWHPG